MAQEYITLQNTESDQALQQAINRAKDARVSAIQAAEAGSVRGAQISKYIDGVLTTAQNNKYADTDELIRALNDAAVATPLLLGSYQTNAPKATSSPKTSTISSTAKTAAEPVVQNATVANAELVAPKAETSEAVTTVSPKTVSEPAEATLAKTTTPAAPKSNRTAGTKISLEIKAQPEVTADTTTSDENKNSDQKIILANATVANNLDAAAAEPEVPNTGEAKNTVGRIIATTVAAIVAMFGAVLIVKRIKKNA